MSDCSFLYHLLALVPNVLSTSILGLWRQPEKYSISPSFLWLDILFIFQRISHLDLLFTLHGLPGFEREGVEISDKKRQL